MKRVGRFLWFWMLILTLSYTILSVGSSFIPPKFFWGLYFLSYGLPIAIVFNLLAVGLYFIARKRLFLIVVSNLILLFGLSNNWAFNTTEKDNTAHYSLLSYNVRLFDFYNWLSGNAWDDWKARTDNGAVLDSMYSLILNQKTDFMCFQEYLNQVEGDYQTKEYFNKNGYPYAHIGYCVTGLTNNYGIATFSKYPIIRKKASFFGTFGINNGFLVTDIQLNSDTIRIINAHLESYRLAKDDYRYLNLLSDSSIAKMERKQTVSLVKKIKRAFIARSNQLDSLVSIIEQSPHPIVLCGDLNELPNSYLYRQLNSKLADSFREKGTGLGSSFITSIPGVRIDYTFHSKEIKTVKHEIIHRKLSDHYPLKFDFKLLNLTEE